MLCRAAFTFFGKLLPQESSLPLENQDALLMGLKIKNDSTRIERNAPESFALLS